MCAIEPEFRSETPAEHEARRALMRQAGELRICLFPHAPDEARQCERLDRHFLKARLFRFGVSGGVTVEDPAPEAISVDITGFAGHFG